MLRGALLGGLLLLSLFHVGVAGPPDRPAGPLATLKSSFMQTDPMKASPTEAVVASSFAAAILSALFKGEAFAAWLAEEVLSGGRLYRWQLAGAAAMALNIWAVGQPGRLDSEAAQQLQAEKKGSVKLPEAQYGRSQFTPSGWAFSIWGPIFMGETFFHLLLQFGTLFTPLSAAPFPAIRETLAKATPAWVGACLFQSLWCATFRPRYRMAGGKYLLISSACLVGAAASLGQYHGIVRESMLADEALGSSKTLALALLPHSLHFAWVCAAMLVNTNGAIAVGECSDNVMTTSAVASAAIASVLTSTLAILRRAPSVAFVGAWALRGIEDDMKRREEGTRGAGYLSRGARLVKIACRVGGAICTVVGIATAVPPSVWGRLSNLLLGKL